MHVVVTGASSGIGEALAREYAKHGASVTLVARRKDRLDKIASELGAPSFVVAADLGDVEHAADWLAPAEAALGPVDVLVNNAGVQIVAATQDTDPAEGEHLLRVDVHAPLRITIAVLKGMLARKEGTIVDVASLAALTPTPGMYYYNAAKAALAAASESLRHELRGTGVHVLTVYPGPVETDMANKALATYGDVPMLKRLPIGNTTELARRIRVAVEKKRPRVIYPASYAASRWFPNTARWLTGRFAPKIKPKAE